MRVNILMILLTIYSVSNAQKMDCSKQVKEYKDFLILKKMDESIQPWESVLKNCPKDNPELYTDGITIYQYRIETAKSSEEKEKVVRDFMKFYDQFHKNFPEKSKAYEIKKGLLLVDNSIGTDDEILTLFESGFSKVKDVEGRVIFSYFKLFNKKYKNTDSKISTNTYVEKYSSLYQLTNEMLLSKPKYSDEYNATLRSLKSEARSVINCENLTAYYDDKINENKENVQWFETALDILSNRCSDKPIFLSMAQKFYDLNKTAKSSSFLAMASVKNRKNNDAKKYFEEAAILENDSIEKAKIYYNLGATLYNDDLEKTKQFMNKAISFDPMLDRAYLFLSNAYVNNAEKCTDNNFDKKAVYYLAIQTIKRAQNKNPKFAGKYDSLIAELEKKSLSVEEIFQAKLFGKTYKIKCGINEIVEFPQKK
jgi:tetratricopeptide (TPR) repeat protein